MPNPTISVIMPAYNAEKYINEAIDSILAQTFTDFEFIIIDDGSTDSTCAIVESYSDSRIRFFKNEHNLGVAATLNRGLDLARGEYIARMDADDISLPTRFEKQAAYMDSHPDVVVCGTGVECFGARHETRFFSETDAQLKIDLLFGCCFAHPSVIIRSSVISSGFHYDTAFDKMEDYELWWRISNFGKLASIHEILLKYRIHTGQVTQNPSPKLCNQLTELKTRQLKALGISSLSPELTAIYEYCLGKMKNSRENIIRLTTSFDIILTNNSKVGLYDQKLLKNTFRTVINTQLAKLAWKDAGMTASDCGMFASIYLTERFAHSFVSIVRKDLEKYKKRQKLRYKDFTIFSNNCWGGFIYQKYGLRYNTPTIGLFLTGHDFVKFASDWEHYLSLPLKFIEWENASCYDFLKNSNPFPVAMLGDIEIYFMHYHSQDEALEKWTRRSKRINRKRLVFKLSQREKCSREDIETFLKIPQENKICFSYDDIPGAIHIPELRNFCGDEQPLTESVFNELEYLNKIK